MKALKIIFLPALLVIGCMGIRSGRPAEKTTGVPEERWEKQCAEAERFSIQLRSNRDLYWGEGIAPIEGDLGAAKIEAKKRALAELSEQISVKVRSDIEVIVMERTISSRREHDNIVEEEVRSRIETYSEAVIAGSQESQPFIDCPTEGNLTYYIWITRAEYDAKVKEDLIEKKRTVRSILNAGDKEFREGNYITAINSWISARVAIHTFFGGVTLRDTIDGRSEPEEVNIWLDRKMNNFFGNVRLGLLNERFLYDAQGRVQRQPIVFAYYYEEERKYPLPNLPLGIVFLEGRGETSSPAMTGSPHGQAELSIRRIDPSRRLTTARVEVNRSSFPGLDKFSLVPLPSLLIELRKRLTVGVLTVVAGVELEEIKNNSRDTITSTLSSRGYDVTLISGGEAEVSQEDIRRAADRHADYLLAVFLELGVPQSFGPYSNLFRTTCRAGLLLYELPGGQRIVSEQTPESEGFGATANNAIWDAYGRVKRSIETTLESTLGELQ